MQLPFTREEFFDLFAAYNCALWPAVVALWLASLLAAVWLGSSRRPRDRWISGLFATIFLLQAALFFWLGVIRGQLSFRSCRTPWTPIGWFLVAYALLYPAINAVEQGSVLRIPTFGLPCPTTIFTAGLLLLAAPRTRALAIVPIVWSAIGGSAAFSLGVSADYALPLAGASLTVFALQKSKMSSSAVPPLHSPVGR